MSSSSGEFVLHVGTMKSGTTYLQRMMALLSDGLERAGWSYPLVQSKGGVPFNQEAALFGLVGSHVPWVTPSRQATLAPAWERLAEVLAHSGCSTLLSAESMAAMDTEGIRHLLRHLPRAPTRVVITCRDLARTIPSSWQQHVRNGHPMTFEQYFEDIAVAAAGGSAGPAGSNFWRSYRLGALIERWAGEVGIDRVVVVTVPRDSAPSALWGRFAHACGLPVEAIGGQLPDLDDSQAHRSLGWAAAMALQVMVCRMASAGLDAAQVRAHALNVASRLFQIRSGDVPIQVPEHWMPAVRSWAREDCEHIVATGARIVGEMSDLQVLADAVGGTAPEPHEVKRLLVLADAMGDRSCRAAGAAAPDMDVADPEMDTGLVGLVGPQSSGIGALRVALVGSERAAAELSEFATVDPLMPHDRDVRASRWSDAPDALVIQSSCGLAQGPWQHLGSPHAPERAEQLRRLVGSARSCGIPVVVWSDGPRWQFAHALAGLAPLTEHSGTASEIACFLKSHRCQPTP